MRTHDYNSISHEILLKHMMLEDGIIPLTNTPVEVREILAKTDIASARLAKRKYRKLRRKVANYMNGGRKHALYDASDLKQMRSMVLFHYDVKVKSITEKKK